MHGFEGLPFPFAAALSAALLNPMLQVVLPYTAADRASGEGGGRGAGGRREDAAPGHRTGLAKIFSAVGNETADAALLTAAVSLGGATVALPLQLLPTGEGAATEEDLRAASAGTGRYGVLLRRRLELRAALHQVLRARATRATGGPMSASLYLHVGGEGGGMRGGEGGPLSSPGSSPGTASGRSPFFAAMAVSGGPASGGGSAMELGGMGRGGPLGPGTLTLAHGAGGGGGGVRVGRSGSTASGLSPSPGGGLASMSPGASDVSYAPAHDGAGVLMYAPAPVPSHGAGLTHLLPGADAPGGGRPTYSAAAGGASERLWSLPAAPVVSHW